MKRLFLLVIPLLLLSACEFDQISSDQAINAGQEKIMKEANAEVGLPAIVNFQEKKLMKQIFELRDQEKLITYTYIVANQTGKLVFLGKSIGYGLPYATQFTNPQKLVDRYGDRIDSGQEAFVIPQADPNGLFMPESAQGTWVMMIDPTTQKPRPVYIEPEVIVSPYPLPN